MDPESLQKIGRRRGSCLDVCLVLSVIFLFVAVAAVAAGGVMVVRDLQSKVKSSPHATFDFTKSNSNPAYKMEKFVYLEASSSNLTNSTMHWNPVDYAAGESVGSNYVFDSNQHSLQPKQAGTYFMYIELNLTCTFNCSAGILSVQVGDKLTCNVALPAGTHSTPVSRKCWTMSQMDSQRLFTQMTVPKGLHSWKLQLRGSGLGMFLVD